jgi:hypothetical protein
MVRAPLRSPFTHSARQAHGSATLAAKGSRCSQPLPARLVHDRASIKAVARALVLRLLAVLRGHMQDGGNGGFGPVRTYHTNERTADPSASESLQGCPGQAGRPLWRGEWLKRAAQPRANSLAIPWWLISTMLFVTVSSKPICQKLS